MDRCKENVSFNIRDCPACGSLQTEEYLELELSTFFFPLPEEIIKKVQREPFKLGICNSCSHIFQREIHPGLLSLIYGEFYSHYNLDTSIQFQEVYRARTIEFMRGLLKKGNGQKALDIGCGEGTYFPFFEELGYKCFGVEPSEKGEIARLKNPNATVSVDSFETCESQEFKAEFDVVLMNWVLEHISIPADFFQKLKASLKLGSKLVIQVPDIQYYLDNGLSLFYVHEHINYFTADTLEIMLRREGFRIIGKKHGDCPSILMCGEYTGISHNFDGAGSESVEKKKAFLEKSKVLRTRIKEVFSGFDRIVFYGVGLLAFWVSECCLETSEFGKIELLDDNEFYKNKFVPSFNKKLSEFKEGSALDNTLIFIATSPSYHDAIKAKISAKFSGSYQIATISNGNIAIESRG